MYSPFLLKEKNRACIVLKQAVTFHAGSANKYCSETQCDHVGYCQHPHARSIWFSCQGEEEINYFPSALIALLLIFSWCVWVLFQVQVFAIFEDLGISVDVVATSEVSLSLTLDPSKLWSRELIQQASVWTICTLFILDLSFAFPLF